MAWPQSSNNRRLEGEVDRRPLFGALGAAAVLIVGILLVVGGEEHPCEVVHEICEGEIDGGVKSARDVICKSIFWQLKSVWSLEDEKSKDQCEAWAELVEATSDTAVPGIGKWTGTLSEVQERLGAEPAVSVATGSLELGAMSGEWFAANNEGRRLQLQGTLRNSSKTDALKAILCEATVTLRVRGRKQPRTLRSTLVVRDLLGPGGSISVSTEAAIIVGADEMRQIDSVRVDITAKALTEAGDEAGGRINAPGLPRPDYRQRFSVFAGDKPPLQ